MTSANVVLVRSICTAWERGDFSSTEWQIRRSSSSSPMALRRGAGRGLTAWRTAGATSVRRGGTRGRDTEGYREIDDQRVLVLTHTRGRGRARGVEVGKARTRGGGQAGLFHLRDGKLTRLVYDLDRERALADLGLAAKGDEAA